MNDPIAAYHANHRIDILSVNELYFCRKRGSDRCLQNSVVDSVEVEAVAVVVGTKDAESRPLLRTTTS